MSTSDNSFECNRRRFLKAAGIGSASLVLSGVANNTRAADISELDTKAVKIIDLEAHYHSGEYKAYMTKNGIKSAHPEHGKIELDVGAGRIERMDKAGVDIQVLNAGPPDIQQLNPKDGTKWSRILNDELADLIKQHPKRYTGLASIAPQEPEKAAEELDRAISQLGLKGVCLKSHAQNDYLDDKKYRQIFQVADKHDVPVFLHPAKPSTDMLKAYSGYNGVLDGPVLGFGADTSLHAMRLIMSGLFDEYPKLKFIMGHMGEGLPFWMSRIDFFANKGDGKTLDLQKNPSDYIRSNFTVLNSGMNYEPAFLCAYNGLGVDNIAFGIDYPHEDSKVAIDFVNGLSIPSGDKEKIFHLNAEKLLNLS
jgi:predicted TIM-barrel fold metal-dependent hydrolase